MKRTITPLILSVVATVGFAQIKNTSKKYATITLKPGAGISITHVPAILTPAHK